MSVKNDEIKCPEMKVDGEKAVYMREWSTSNENYRLKDH